MNNQEYGQAITAELTTVLRQISLEQAEALIELIADSAAVFIAGAGRSGYMSRAFCMRLMHLGLTTYMVGDTTTPAIQANDLLIVCSGSGETKSLVSNANKAKELGAKVALITINDESTIAKLADAIVKINAVSPKADKEGNTRSIQPMANLFEQCLLLFLDILAIMLMDRKGKTAQEMFTLHANLE